MNYAPSAIRLLIADEQRTLRQNLRRSLESEGGVRILGEAANSSEALSLARQLDPDIVLLDLNLYRAFEASLLRRVTARFVVMIDAVEKAAIVEAFSRGAQAVVLRTTAPRVLLRSFQSVMAGHYWLEGETLGILVQALRELSPQGVSVKSPKDYGLTPRERDIVVKIASGCSNREVSQEFLISERTVKHHLTNIFDKVGVSSRLELALFAVNHHLMEDGVAYSDLGKASGSAS
jgi:two-component system, NarL family, nitrate/nitrite response regulator NarL